MHVFIKKDNHFLQWKKKPSCDLNLGKSEAENKSTLAFTWFHEILCDNVTVSMHGIN